MKKRSVLSKVLLTFILALVLVYSIKNVSLSLIGKTTKGYIVKTTQIYSKTSKTNTNRFKNTDYYYFELDGKKYENKVTYKTDAQLIEKDNKKKEETIVQYIGFYPNINTLEKYNNNNLGKYIMWCVFIVISIIGILSVNEILFKKSDEKSKDNIEEK